MIVQPIHVKMVESAQMMWTPSNATVPQDMKETIVEQVSHFQINVDEFKVKGKYRLVVSKIKMAEPAQVMWTPLHATVLQDMKEKIVEQVSHFQINFD